MTTIRLVLFCAAAAPCMAGCVSATQTLAPVGPVSAGAAAAGSNGYIEVFTATRKVDVDFESYFHPHLGYEIDDPSGREVRFVANHTSDMDEAPDVVSLPPGRYRIVAESTWCGLVTVPVVIERGRTTVVRLDGSWRGPGGAGAVRLSNGEIVGVSAASAGS